MANSFLSKINDRHSVITPIEGGIRFPEILEIMVEKYAPDITIFCELIRTFDSSAELLTKIRSPHIPSGQRMSLLKMFRRSVSLVCDTETTKKINSVSTESLIKNYGHSFKPIHVLKAQFGELSDATKAALAIAIGEYDLRGQLGYELTATFFDWFTKQFPTLSITGPRGAGRDIELRTIFPEFTGDYPCDFVVRRKADSAALLVGFARYNSTRGGAQSDDRTGGNANKVDKAREFCIASGKKFRLLFVADGPGLAHGDTWVEACHLDDSWEGNVRVTTVKLAPKRVTLQWISGA